jgi:hypothetical protein
LTSVSACEARDSEARDSEVHDELELAARCERETPFCASFCASFALSSFLVLPTFASSQFAVCAAVARTVL